MSETKLVTCLPYANRIPGAHHENTSVVATSAQFDERLMRTYDRVGMRPGMLEKLAGVRERRWWPTDVSFAEGKRLRTAWKYEPGDAHAE
jgi:hypothetical protein